MECCCKKECHGKINLKKHFDIWSKVSVGGEIVIGGGWVSEEEERGKRKERTTKEEQGIPSDGTPLVLCRSFGSTGS